MGKVVSVVCSGKQSSSSLVGVLVVLIGEGYELFSDVSLFTCMHCGDLNSDDKDYLSEIHFSLLKGSQ